MPFAIKLQKRRKKARLRPSAPVTAPPSSTGAKAARARESSEPSELFGESSMERALCPALSGKGTRTNPRNDWLCGQIEAPATEGPRGRFGDLRQFAAKCG